MLLQGEREQRLTRGVFPTAPVKPLTECDVNPLESMGLTNAAIGVIIVSEKRQIIDQGSTLQYVARGVDLNGVFRNNRSPGG